MMKDCKLRRIKLSILGKIKIYKKTTVLEERRLKKLHKINPCFVYINPREEALCLKQMKGRRKKQYSSNTPVQQESMRQASPFIPNPRILENKPFTKQISLMAMKQDAFFRKYNLDRDAIMKRCLFYKEDINHFIMFLQRYFNMKEREKIMEENQKCMERFKDVRLNQRVRVLLTPLKEVNKRVREKTKDLGNCNSAKLIDITTVVRESNGAKNCRHTDDGMTDADEMEVDKTLPQTSNRQNKIVPQIEIDEFFIADGNEDEVCKTATNSETGANKSGDVCYAVSLAAQLEHQDKMKFKDILMDVATEFEKFSLETRKSDTEKTENAEKTKKISQSTPVSNGGELNKEDQNNFDMHEETACTEDNPKQAYDFRDVTSLAEIKDKENMVVAVETGRNEEDSSFMPECGRDNSNITNQNDSHVFERQESLKQASDVSVVSKVQDGVNFKHFISNSDKECEKGADISNNGDNGCEKDGELSNNSAAFNVSEKDGELSNNSVNVSEKDGEVSNSSDNECEKDGEVSNSSDNECEKDELSNNSANECEKDGELSNNSNNECEKNGELSNNSDIESEKHDDLPEKSDLDRESVIQRCTSDFKSTASDDELLLSGYSSGDKSKDKTNQSDLESEEPVTESKNEESTGIENSEEEIFCGMDTNTMNDSRTDVSVISAALLETVAEHLEMPMTNVITGAYEGGTENYDSEIHAVIANFSFLVSAYPENKEG